MGAVGGPGVYKENPHCGLASRKKGMLVCLSPPAWRRLVTWMLGTSGLPRFITVPPPCCTFPETAA